MLDYKVFIFLLNNSIRYLYRFSQFIWSSHDFQIVNLCYSYVMHIVNPQIYSSHVLISLYLCVLLKQIIKIILNIFLFLGLILKNMLLSEHELNLRSNNVNIVKNYRVKNLWSTGTSLIFIVTNCKLRLSDQKDK